MYSKEAVKQLKREDVQSQLYLMVKSRCFYSFFIIKCKNCGKSVISVHIEHLDNGDQMAYFVCSNCGKKTKKLCFIIGDKGINEEGVKAHYSKEMKHVIPECIIYKGQTNEFLKRNEEYRGFVLNSKSFLVILQNKNILLPSDEVKIIEWQNSKYQPLKSK